MTFVCLGSGHSRPRDSKLQHIFRHHQLFFKKQYRPNKRQHLNEYILNSLLAIPVYQVGIVMDVSGY